MPAEGATRKYLAALFLLFLVVAFVGLRLTNLTLLPMYVDEGLHIQRALTILETGQLLTYTEGGKFLQIWLITLVLPLVTNPLYGARMVTVVVGLLSSLGIYFLGQALFRQWIIGAVAALLYLAVPFALFLDRLALNDNLLAMLAVYVMLFGLKLAAKPRIWFSLGLGGALGLIALTKLNGFIFWTVPLLIFFILQKPWKRLLLAYLLAFIIVSPMLPLLPEQWQAPSRKTWLTTETSQPVMALLARNIQLTWSYYQTYLTWPIWLMALAGIGLSLWYRMRRGILLLLVTLLYYLVFGVAAIDLHSRYIFPIVPFLLLFAASIIVALGRQLAQPFNLGGGWPSIISLGLALLLSYPALQFDFGLLSEPDQAPLTAPDRWLFIEGSLSGYGLAETVSFLREQAAQSKAGILVIRHDTSGFAREGLDIFLADEADAIELVSLNLVTLPPHYLFNRLEEQSRPVFLVVSLPQDPGAAPYQINFKNNPYCPLAAEFPRPGGRTQVSIFHCRLPEESIP